VRDVSELQINQSYSNPISGTSRAPQKEGIMKSIWDGWERQAFGIDNDGQGGNCAMGYLMRLNGRIGLFEFVRVQARLAAVAAYIKQHYELPDSHVHERFGGTYYPKKSPEDTIVYANNNLRLTPDDFRRIDIETQIQAGMPDVERLLESVEEEVPVG
jgi:hypothetical protein